VTHRPPSCRTDLIEIVQRRAPSSVIRRACLSGRVENLGAFKRIGQRGLPGWIVSVQSPNHRVYFVAVLCNDVKHDLEVALVDDFDWIEWAGNFDGPRVGLGDYPMKNLETCRAHATPA
jgi:hypothetical protein